MYRCEADCDYGLWVAASSGPQDRWLPPQQMVQLAADQIAVEMTALPLQLVNTTPNAAPGTAEERSAAQSTLGRVSR
ncbi:hypothetical protein AAFF_G00183720 [Aldrovandia affinis]|uniref:Uncharacterized protein n=1 Tax=Aldrovandia affinis TaxID=143900 RepID=A0AAD7RK48_9TELE|nr:hypothetical protein AAFF_G00183720 [Aldrovandia affinis]